LRILDGKGPVSVFETGPKKSGRRDRRFNHERIKIMEILYAIVIGLVIGIVAKFLMPGKDPGGFIITTLLGIAGSIVAKYIGQALGWYGAGEAAGFIASVVGAIILLVLYRMVVGRRAQIT
jgi:uncharacterized membrane protein YeaQ/YmgE (transglycosylase-associated protein family)